MKGRCKSYVYDLSEVPLFVDVAYIAELMRVSPRTVLREINGGRIKAVRIGKQYRIPKDEVIRLYNAS